jgi:hypothetical protein
VLARSVFVLALTGTDGVRGYSSEDGAGADEEREYDLFGEHRSRKKDVLLQRLLDVVNEVTEKQ